MENNTELLEMREQLAIFKQQLASQEIINNKLMRKAMAEKASRLSQMKISFLAIGVFGLVFSVPMFYSYGFPIYFVLYTLTIFIVSMIATIIFHRKVDKADFMNGDLKTVVTEIKTLRKNYKRWYWVGIPLVIIFIILFYDSLIKMDKNLEIIRATMIGGGVGVLIGGFLGIKMNNKINKLCDEIIRDIEAQ